MKVQYTATIAAALSLIASCAPAPIVRSPVAPKSRTENVQTIDTSDQPKPAFRPALSRTTTRQTDALYERVQEIVSELERPFVDAPLWAAEWAGTYNTLVEQSMSIRIRLAPNSGVAYTKVGCSGVYDANYGEVVESFHGGIKVKLAFDENATSRPFMSSTLYFVQWDDRHFLVPESQMQRVVNNYNAGGLTRLEMSGIPLKQNSDDYPDDHLQYAPNGFRPKSKPQLPERWAKLLRD